RHQSEDETTDDRNEHRQPAERIVRWRRLFERQSLIVEQVREEIDQAEKDPCEHSANRAYDSGQGGQDEHAGRRGEIAQVAGFRLLRGRGVGSGVHQEMVSRGCDAPGTSSTALLPRRSLGENFLKAMDEIRSGILQFAMMGGRKRGQRLLPFGRKADEDLSPVLLAAPPNHVSALLGARHELDRAVMLDQQAFSNIADRALIIISGLDRQQQLMLLRDQARFPRGILTEPLESPDEIPKLCQCTISLDGVASAHRRLHLYRITI